MSKSHIQQNLPLKNKVIPVDSDTMFLAHFDNTVNDVLKGTQPLEPQISTLVSEGYYGSGVIVEEGTTNLWTGNYTLYNNFGVPSSIVQTGETYRDAPIYRIGMTVTDAFSNRLADFQGNFANHGVYGGNLSWQENTPYVSSIYWRPVNKPDLILGGTASNTGGWSSGGNQILTDGWRRFYRYRTGVGVATKVDVVHHSIVCPSLQLNETVYFEVCGAQTEQGKRYPTSYIPSGTTRATGKLNYPISITRPSTISFWVQPRISDNYNISVNWIMGQSPYDNNFLIWKRTSETYYRVRVGGVDLALSPGDITQFTWSYVAIVFDSTETRVYINGLLKGKCGVLSPISILTVGSAETYETGNNIFDELRIDKVARTSDEILAWYYSNSPFWPKGIYKVSY